VRERQWASREWSLPAEALIDPVQTRCQALSELIDWPSLKARKVSSQCREVGALRRVTRSQRAVGPVPQDAEWS